jgi:hypothetical protein
MVEAARPDGRTTALTGALASIALALAAHTPATAQGPTSATTYLYRAFFKAACLHRRDDPR